MKQLPRLPVFAAAAALLLLARPASAGLDDKVLVFSTTGVDPRGSESIDLGWSLGNLHSLTVSLLGISAAQWSTYHL